MTVLDMIKENKSLDKIKQELNIDNNELLQQLKDIKKYKNLLTRECINIEPDSNTYKMLVISDLHIGSKEERFDLLEKLYDYALDNDIKTIINLGDLIDGKTSKLSIEKQLNLLLKNYPYNESINNIILLGNHDFHSLYYDNYDIADCLKERKDFINAGYGIGYINIYNKYIGLFHNLSLLKVKRLDFYPFMNLYGHRHSYKVNIGDELNIKIPTLSNKTHNDSLPSFLDIKLEYDGKLEKAIIKNIIFSSKTITTNELEYNIPVLKKKYTNL